MRLFVTAGEPSGDRLGAALIRGLRQLEGNIVLAGVGGPLMQAEGLESLFPMDDLSVMGIAEVAPKYLHLKRRIRQTAVGAADHAPDVVVTIDSPDFSFRVADALRRIRNVRVVHYVAPTVWAWRKGRAARLRGRVDQILALFPFEPPYFEAEGVRCDFVGHPVATEPPPPPADLAVLRARIEGRAPVIAVLPGSRRSEVGRLAPRFGAALRLVAARHPQMQVLVPTLPHLADGLAGEVAGWIGAPQMLTAAAERRAALWAADFALTKSGTISLELAAARTPMVVAHDVNVVSRWIIARLLTTDTVTLVNHVTGTRAVPELLGRDCRPQRIADALLSLMERPEAQLGALDLTMQRLGRGGEPPGLRAARAVLDGLSG